ncbi:hypothetical protein [Peribacillus simplex]|nr:hypothetical protein [Peribacillus simplex]
MLYEILIELKKFATLLPNNWLVEIQLGAFGEEAWLTAGGKGANF